MRVPRPRLGTRWRARMRAREEAAARVGEEHKLVAPAEWGLDWLGLDPAHPDPKQALLDYSAAISADSTEFFALPAVPAFAPAEDGHVTFPSAVPGAHAANNTVHGDFYATPKPKRAVVLMGHWNSTRANYRRFATVLRRAGIAVLHLSLPYHDERLPAGHDIAEYLVSANLGRTMAVNRQAVLDARAGLEFLLAQGYHRIGVIGASIGACIAFLAGAHEPRVGGVVCLHVASRYGDVIWGGRSTRHIRAALEGTVTLPELNAILAPLGPLQHVERMVRGASHQLFISGKYDQIFRPAYTRALAEALRGRAARLAWIKMACGHHTLADLPFSAWAAAASIRFFRRVLGRGVSPRARGS